MQSVIVPISLLASTVTMTPERIYVKRPDQQRHRLLSQLANAGRIVVSTSWRRRSVKRNVLPNSEGNSDRPACPKQTLSPSVPEDLTHYASPDAWDDSPGNSGFGLSGSLRLLQHHRQLQTKAGR